MFRADAAAGDTVTLDQVPKAVMATVPDEQCGAGDWIRRHHAVANADDGTPLIPVAPAKAKKEKGPLLAEGGQASGKTATESA